MSSSPVDFLSTLSGGDFYVTGGTLRPDAPSYVERKADRELCEGLLHGEFCYVLTSRQMGKSSLMVRTVRRLRQEGVVVAVLDLTAIGQNLTLEQWYDGLLSRLGQQLDLEDEILAFTSAHPELGPLQRWMMALEEVVLRRVAGKVVIFVDEIDIVRSLPFSTDEFFAGIRECHNRRSRESGFNRLAFGLLGVATPTDLIRDTRMTPFNIGRRIELNDFSASEAAPLARGLGADESNTQELLKRILYWTGGHPYLTQRLCRAVAEAVYQPAVESSSTPPAPPVLPTQRTVDQLADKLFLTRQARDRDDNLIFVRERLLRSEVDVAGLLLVYRKIHGGQLVPDDDTNSLISVLRLSGITRGINGYLQVRNRIYWQVFDLNWIQTNMPEAEVRRQRRAGRRGMLIGFGIALFVLVSYLLVRPAWTRHLAIARATRTLQDVQTTYRELVSYQDAFESTLDIGLGGINVTVKGSGQVVFERPDKLSLTTRSSLNNPEIELRLITDGHRSSIYAPSLNQFQVFDPPPWRNPFDLPPPIARHLGPVRLLPLYRLLLNPRVLEHFQANAQNLQYLGETQIDGQAARMIAWDQDARAFAGVAGMRGAPAEHTTIPITAWVSRSSHLVVQLSADFSCWAEELCGKSTDLPATTLVLTEIHKSIQTSKLPEVADRFRWNPAPDARLVDRLELPPPNFSSLASGKRQFLQLITPRISQAPRNLIDLSEYYNAALVQSWHPGMGNNSLEVLPPGLLQLGGTLFDVRGIVQLAGHDLQRTARGSYPPRVVGIPVSQTCRQLNFLHATGWRTRDGTLIGNYIVHYADGEEHTIPIIYGEDVRDWNAGGDSSTELKRGSIVWSATNKAPFLVRLFKSTWVNPKPDTEITTIDYVSTVSESAPFLIAITAQP
jgi:hypothetical protein